MKFTNLENKFFRALLLLLAIGLLFISCRKDDSEPFSPYADEDVYVAGGMQETYYTRAVYWKNDVPVVLLDGPRASIAYDIFLDNTDVYAVGSFKDETYQDKPALWKNTTLFPLSTNNTIGEAKAVYVSENIHYIVGYEQHGAYKKAKLWMSGFSLTLKPNDTADSEFNSVYVDHHKVYIAGYEYEGSIKKAKYWIYQPGGFSPSPTPLSDAQSFTLAQSSYGFCDARSITVKSDKIYVAGTDGDKSTIWIDGQPTVIYTGIGPNPESLFVKGSTVYAAGTSGDWDHIKSWYWNGNMNELSAGNAEYNNAMDIAVGKSNIYIPGYVSDKQEDWAVIWVNGVLKSLAPNKERSWAHSVFVVEK